MEEEIVRIDEKGKAFVLTGKGMEHTPDSLKPYRRVGMPIGGNETEVPRSWLENGFVELGEAPKVAMATEKQLKYANHIASVTGAKLPDTLSKKDVSDYITKNSGAVRQSAENKRLQFACRIADGLGIDRAKIGEGKSIGDFINAHMKEYNDWERREIIARAPIEDVAQSLGYHVESVGRWKTLSEHDSVRIDPAKGTYVHYSVENGSHHQGGSVIDFTMEFGNMDLKEAMGYLRNMCFGISESGVTVPVRPVAERQEAPKHPNGVQLPPPDPTGSYRNVFAYLNKTRGIDPQITKEMVTRGMLYQDELGNCVFVCSEGGKPVFACKRGTNTYKKYIADCSGNDYKRGFYINNGTDRMVITESVIDAMSVMTALKMNGIDYKEYSYLCLSGVGKTDPVITRIDENEIKHIYYALDNDEAGMRGFESIADRIDGRYGLGFDGWACAPPNRSEKDWNEYLLAAKAAGQTPYVEGFDRNGELHSLRDNVGDSGWYLRYVKDDSQEIESFADAVKRETAASGRGGQKQERGRRQEMTMEM